MQTQKKIKQTDAIFAKLKVVNTAADETKTVLRVSWDAKTAVKIGDFVRGGQNRLAREGADHDFEPRFACCDRCAKMMSRDGRKLRKPPSLPYQPALPSGTACTDN